MEAMIERKKQFGNLNHGSTGAMTNDLFDDPPYLLKKLAATPWLVTRGKPDESGLLKLFTIGERMYKVFTEEEQELWKEWIRSLPESDDQAQPSPGTGSPPPSTPGPGTTPRYRRHLTFASPAAAFDADPRGLRGAGGLQ
jgi:hypothetical protein